MLNIPQLLATEINLKPHQVQNALELLAEGATIPFIARYRKERTDEMNEVQLRELADRYTYLTELEERKSVILSAIAQQGKLQMNSKPKSHSAYKKLNLRIYTYPIDPSVAPAPLSPEKKDSNHWQNSSSR